MSDQTQTFSALEKIVLERQRQDLKWGPPEELPKDRTPEHWLAILMEEVGELAEAVVEKAAGGHRKWDSAIHKELIQTAAVAISWLEWLAVNEPD